MLVVLIAVIGFGRLKMRAATAWIWLVLSGGFLSGMFGCMPFMMYGPGPDYSDVPDVELTDSIQPLYGPPPGDVRQDQVAADVTEEQDTAVSDQ